MSLLERVGRRGRFDNLREIRTLDPYDDADRDRIVTLTGRHDFPWDMDQGVAIAFLRDYGVPSIATLLDRTKQFEGDGIKRYDDTLYFQEEAVSEGVDSERSRRALERLNKIHGHYSIPNDEFQYVLATTLVGPVRWIDRYGWRPMDPVELVALTRFTTRFGELMNITGLPETYEGYLKLLVDYEREHFAHDPAATRLTEATIKIGKATSPWYLRLGFRRVSIAMMDESLRVALGMPKQPQALVAAVDLGLRLRAKALRFLAAPRSAAYERVHPTYPNGYQLDQIGPSSMLDRLNREANTKEQSVA